VHPTINSDLIARIKPLGLRASRIAEEVLAEAPVNQRRARILAEVEANLRAVAGDGADPGGCPTALRT
jgi:post-segregation antitoxin (ccd killing protein)